jgi:hypothetical protein
VAVLNERQKKAQRLADELGRCNGCWVTTPMPLDDSTRALRFQTLDSERESVISELCEAGWIPNLVSAFPRFTSAGLVAASMYEVNIPKERPSIVDDRPKMPSDIAALAEREEKKKAAEFISAFRKSAGLDK